jgi:hypothetical protein
VQQSSEAQRSWAELQRLDEMVRQQNKAEAISAQRASAAARRKSAASSQRSARAQKRSLDKLRAKMTGFLTARRVDNT